MSKPEQLIGEVQKFEDSNRSLLNKLISLRIKRAADQLQGIDDARLTYEVDSTYAIQELIDLYKFYNQSFKPDMIEEYFANFTDGYKDYNYDTVKEYDVNDDKFIRVESRTKISDAIGNKIETKVFFGKIKDVEADSVIYKDYTRYQLLYPQPKTLSDFINACLNNDINLEWK